MGRLDCIYISILIKLILEPYKGDLFINILRCVTVSFMSNNMIWHVNLAVVSRGVKGFQVTNIAHSEVIAFVK
jgi:hypothetical protein